MKVPDNFISKAMKSQTDEDDRMKLSETQKRSLNKNYRCKNPNCPLPGKHWFYVPDPETWAFRKHHGYRSTPDFCSWGCQRAWERGRGIDINGKKIR